MDTMTSPPGLGDRYAIAFLVSDIRKHGAAKVLEWAVKARQRALKENPGLALGPLLVEDRGPDSEVVVYYCEVLQGVTP